MQVFNHLKLPEHRRHHSVLIDRQTVNHNKAQRQLQFVRLTPPCRPKSTFKLNIPYSVCPRARNPNSAYPLPLLSGRSFQGNPPKYLAHPSDSKSPLDTIQITSSPLRSFCHASPQVRFPPAVSSWWRLTTISLSSYCSSATPVRRRSRSLSLNCILNLSRCLH